MQDQRDAVLSFHHRELTRLGWIKDRDPIPSSGELVMRGWCKPRILYRLAIYDPAQYDRTNVPAGERFRTVFDASIVAVDRPCPLPSPTFR